MSNYLPAITPIAHLAQISVEGGLIIAGYKSWTIKRQNDLHGIWDQKNWLNIPGPFYGALTDTCCAGTPAAPYNVMADLEGQEFIYRQPRNLGEVGKVLAAAEADPFGGYGWDGNHHWTLSSIRDWWRQRIELTAQLNQIKANAINSRIAYYSDESNYSNSHYYGKEPLAEGITRYPKEEFLMNATRWRIAITEWERYWTEELEAYLGAYAFLVDTGNPPQDTDLLPSL